MFQHQQELHFYDYSSNYSNQGSEAGTAPAQGFDRDNSNRNHGKQFSFAQKHLELVIESSTLSQKELFIIFSRRGANFNIDCGFKSLTKA